jgi:hypothetical protein
MNFSVSLLGCGRSFALHPISSDRCLPDGLFVVQKESRPFDRDVPEPWPADFIAALQANGTL